MKDRLSELIKNGKEKCTNADCGLCGLAKFGGFPDCRDKFLAGHLLENGVIAPPCKVGDVVYSVFEDDVIEDEIILIEVTESAIYLSTCTERYMWVNGYLYSEMLDQKLYITKEEAEAALKGAEGK